MIVFFDIDETLVNQRQAELYASSYFLRAYGAHFPQVPTVAAFCRQWCVLREKHAPAFLEGRISFQEQRRRRIRELFAEREPVLPDEEADARYALYNEHYRRGWSLFDDVLPCLESLSGCTLGIISNGNTDQQLGKLEKTRIRQRFQVVVISEHAGASKPHRDIFLLACKNARCRIEDCIYVGDRLDVDARGSRAAGMRGIWLNRGQTAAPADVETIHSLADLKARLLS